ncbi:MAG TPA: gamma-glutamyltransferase, partial [Opitutaceae bacterium]|nr:gamma-glutamyltransferase [Opitutaceae bacterium]
PCTNMCPTLVTRGGAPVVAAGAAGGTRIPNSMFEVLLNRVALDAPLETALSSPRLDTNGTPSVGLEKKHTPEDEAFFQRRGYAVTRVTPAYVSAVSFDPKTGRAGGQAL